MLEDKGLALNLRGGHRCIMGFPDTRSILQAERLIEQHSTSNFLKKTSTSICELEFPDHISENIHSDNVEINEPAFLITPPPTVAKIDVKSTSHIQSDKTIMPIELDSISFTPYIDEQISKMAATRTRVVAKVRKMMAKRIRKCRPAALKLAKKYSLSLLRTSAKCAPLEELSAWKELLPNFPTLPSIQLQPSHN